MKRQSPVFQSLVLTSAVYLATGVRTNVTCNGASMNQRFDRVFTLGISFKGNHVAQIDDKTVNIVPKAKVPVSNVSGTLTHNQTYLTAALNVDCPDVDDIKCVVFGLPKDMEDFTSTTFSPNMTFDVDASNMSAYKIPDKAQYPMGEVLKIQCSADIGSTTPKWRFRIVLEGIHGKEYVEEDGSVVSSVSRTQCAYHTKATINVTVKQEAQVRVHCNIGETPIGTVVFESMDIEDILRFHLFLSSIILVYCPFILMPSLWCSCPKCSTSWRNPENTDFKFLRSLISLFDGFAFLGWWVGMHVMYGQRQNFTGYATFAWIEGAFIFLYALFRCFFKFLESKDSYVGPRREYNGRVATSFGAVITPLICWLMIKYPRGLSCNTIEAVFWTLAIISLIAFMYVSHEREYEHWDKQE